MLITSACTADTGLLQVLKASGQPHQAADSLQSASRDAEVADLKQEVGLPTLPCHCLLPVRPQTTSRTLHSQIAELEVRALDELGEMHDELLELREACFKLQIELSDSERKRCADRPAQRLLGSLAARRCMRLLTAHRGGPGPSAEQAGRCAGRRCSWTGTWWSRAWWSPGRLWLTCTASSAPRSPAQVPTLVRPCHCLGVLAASDMPALHAQEGAAGTHSGCGKPWCIPMRGQGLPCQEAPPPPPPQTPPLPLGVTRAVAWSQDLTSAACAGSSQGGSPMHGSTIMQPGTPDNGSEMADYEDGVPAAQHEKLREEGDLIMLVRYSSGRCQPGSPGVSLDAGCQLVSASQAPLAVGLCTSILPVACVGAPRFPVVGRCIQMPGLVVQVATSHNQQVNLRPLSCCRSW